MFLEEGRENMPIFHLGFKRALGKDGCAKSDQFSEKFQKGGRRSFSIQYTLLAFIICLLHWKLLVYIPLSASKFASYLGNFFLQNFQNHKRAANDIKGEAASIIENTISPDYVLCYIPRAMAILN